MRDRRQNVSVCPSLRMTRPLTMPITRAEVRVTNPAEMEMWSWTTISRAGVVYQPELSRII